MAKKKNTLLRTLVPVIAILAGAGVVAAVAVNTANQNKPRQTASDTATEDTPTPALPESKTGDASPDGATDDGAAETPASDAQADAPSATQAPTPAPKAAASPPGDATADQPGASDGPAADAGTLRARVFEGATDPGGIGTLEGEDGSSMRIDFSPYGAGIASLKLGEGFYNEVDTTDHVELQAQRSVPRPGRSDLTAVPFAALAVRVAPAGSADWQTIPLATPGVWRPVTNEPGTFEAFVENDAGEALLRFERRYELIPGTFRLTITRRTENLSGAPLSVVWSEAGPIDLPEPTTRYGGDKRRVRFGYLEKPEAQAGSTFVTADMDLTGRLTVLGKRTPDEAGYDRWAPEAPLWPTPKTREKGQRLVWTAFTGRYFAVALHPIFDPDSVTAGGAEKLFAGVEQIDRLVLNPYLGKKEADKAVMLMRLAEQAETIPAGGAATDAMGVYAGPLLKDDLKGDPLLVSLNLPGLIVYNFGGPCGEMCTFGWLTHVLFAVLSFAHSVTGDWALAIILLVLVVRTTLHPITKWSQIRLLRFSKQMQSIAPLQQKIREKYKDDPKRQQQEMAKLWQEEGINPAGALGCLPMLLQSPVWIALYATLYFAAELRHEAAFWGFFQSITGGKWMFLADLARPDRMVPLPKALHFTPPLIGGIYGEIRSINLLPVLMGVVFWAHQKYLSPPPSASMTPEQEQQQKIMRVMFPLMMPIFMYAAPSGLTIYFITNSTLGILENKHIRHNAEKKGLLDPEKIKAEKARKRATKAANTRAPKPGGFMAKLQAMAEQGQQMQQQKAKKVQNTARKPEPRDRNYKKRK
jgi:YidC/Oxa1 family membrane protein insertase